MSKYTVTITEEIDPKDDTENNSTVPKTFQRFSATVDELDLSRVIQAVYHKPRAPRKPRSDSGKTREAK